MDKPVLLLPVTYCSPQHISLGFDSIKIANFFKGAIVTIPSKRVQWFNNCDIKFSDMGMSSWCGRDFITNSGGNGNDSCGAQVNLMVKWPTGPMGPFIKPKWNISTVFSPITLSLTKNNYALFTHVVFNNISEPSRHLEEWNALKNLPREELERYKEQVLVHFGYDKKDSKPTTYHFGICVEDIVIRFLENEDNMATTPTSTTSLKKDQMKDTGGKDEHVDSDGGIADVKCSQLSWSLSKNANQIVQQKLSCQSISLQQTSGKREWSRHKELLSPLVSPSSFDAADNEKDGGGGEEEKQLTLLYTSTSKPCEPEIYSCGDVLNSMQIGDR
eukprot:1962663-Ditylum_brightwellii.AAC.1